MSVFPIPYLAMAVVTPTTVDLDCNDPPDAVIDAIIIGHVNITRPNFEKYDNGNLRKSTFVYFQHYMKQLLN